MSATAFRFPKRAPRERGFILVTGMLFLVVMTLLGLALFRSTGLLDRLTANTRDKQRSFESAQSALEYGMWWLGTAGGNGSSCASNTNATVATLHVCTEALSTSLTTIAAVGTAVAPAGWVPQGFTFTPGTMTVVAGGGGMATASDVNYSKAPVLYIENLGLSADGKSQYYQVTAAGYGGDPNTVSVVRGTFRQTSKSKNLGAP